MMKNVFQLLPVIAVFSLLLLSCSKNKTIEDPCNYVDPFIGTGGVLSVDDRADEDHWVHSTFDHKNEIAEPGYYSVYLDDENVKAELSCTQQGIWQ